MGRESEWFIYKCDIWEVHDEKTRASKQTNQAVETMRTNREQTNNGGWDIHICTDANKKAGDYL